MTIFRTGLRSSVLAAMLIGLVAAPAVAMVGPSTTDTPLASSTVMVLFHRNNVAGFCTGTVLAPDIVLTAAHCAPEGADIRIHLPSGGTDPVLLPISGIARNPEYRPNAIVQRVRSIDLALLHLPSPLPSAFVPADIARTSGTKIGARFVASGYGVTREGDPATSGTLRSVTLAAEGPLSTVLLWASDPTRSGAGACTGDSGGPVSAEGSRDVAAVVMWSAGAGPKKCGQLTQAVWLVPQKAWIDRVRQAWQPPTASDSKP